MTEFTLYGRNEASSASKSNSGRQPPSLAQLSVILAGCRKQESGAQQAFVLATQDQVYRLLFRLVGRQDAEDVAQEVYLQVFQRLHQFRGDSSVATWLYRVTVNQALQHLRRERSRRPQLLNLTPHDDLPDRSDPTEARDLLARALEKIDPDLRAVFLLREVEKMSYNEIAATLQVPMGTVASRLSRAREELQEHLRQLGWDG